MNYIFKVLIIFILITLLASVVLAGNKGDTETSIEGFTLYRYEEDLKWKLSGKKASKGNKNLIVKDFNLVIKKNESENYTTLCEFSGQEIRLQSGEKERAWIPGGVKISIREKVKGTAEKVSYYFSTGEVRGRKIRMVRGDQNNMLSVEGTRFEYIHSSEMLFITRGFHITAHDSKGPDTEISGGKLTWNLEKEIRMEENVVSKTDGGWELSAKEMVLNPDTDTLECSGKAVAVKDELRVQGESIIFNGSDEEVSVKSGKLVLEDKRHSSN